MAKDPLVVKMGKEVFDRFLLSEKEVFSYPAFIFAFKEVIKKKDNRGKYGFGPGTYGYFKKATEGEAKHLIKKHNEAEPQEVRREIRVPELDPGKLKYTLNLF